MQDILVRVGGAAGDGIASIGETLTRSLSRMGLHAFGFNAYQSVIRGGHVWFQSRGSTEPVHSQGDGCDILYALDLQTAQIHGHQLRQGGTLVYDPEKFSLTPDQVPVGAKLLPVPTLEIARKYTPQSILQNAAGLGATSFLAGIPPEILERTLADSFGKKRGEVVDWNLRASADGYEHAKKQSPANEHAIPPAGPPKHLMTGNQAIALGSVAAGVKFLSQYPMTPASSIMHWMAAHSRDLGVVVKQAEDELAAINMAIGASYGGVRAMTATSGGGFSLMVEALGMAGMCEIPLVVVESQRSGPSTGLPTKTEQGDLNLMLGAGQSEFPRAIIAPANPAEAYHAARKAFELAERYQTPVLLASDLHLSENLATVEPGELGLPGAPESLVQVEPNGHDYLRYQYTPNGVSPRSLPGQPGLQWVAASDEHDEKAHLISDVKSGIPVWVAERTRMMDKRMRKLAGLTADSEPPLLEGPAKAPLTFLAWGSTIGPVRDAMRLLAERGVETNLIAVRTVYPLHVPQLVQLLDAAQKVILVEGNFSGQLGRLIRTETGRDLTEKLLKYDGEPFYPFEIVAKALEVNGRVRN